MKKDIVDMIAQWGSTHIQNKTNEDYLCRLEAEFVSAFEKEDIPAALQEHFEELAQKTNEGIETLSSIKLLSSHKGSEMWDRAVASLETFDEINYVMDALLFFKPIQDIDAVKSFLPGLDALLQNVLDWIYEGSCSPLRLSMLNEIRLQRITLIDEDMRYLFPWYELCSHYDPTVLNSLVDAFELFQNRLFEKLPDGLQEHAFEIGLALESDPELRSFIHTEHALQKTIRAAVEKRSALRLLMIGDRAAHDHRVSPAVYGAGLYRTAASVINKTSGAPAEDRLCLLFLAAFCGPGLTEEQRFKALSEVENTVQALDAGRFSGTTGNVLQTVQGWFQEKVADDQLANTAFPAWSDYMQQAACRAEAETYQDTAAQVWSALQKVLTAGPAGAAVPWLEKKVQQLIDTLKNIVPDMRETAAACLEGRLSLRPQYAPMAAGAGTFPASADQSNFIWLPCPGLREDRPLALFKKPGPDASEEEKLACAVYSWYQAQQDDYSYFACFLDANGVLTKQPQQLPRAGRSIQLKEIPESTAACIIVIGRSDHIQAEWDIWNEEKARPLGGGSRVYYFVLTPGRP